MGKSGSQSQSGFMLLVVPLVLGALALLTIQSIHRSRVSMRIAGAELHHLGVSLCASRCASLAANAMGRTLATHERIAAGQRACSCADAGPRPVDCAAEVSSPAVGAEPNCYGVETVLTEVALDIRCRDAAARTSRLKEDVAFREIPIFQFAVFFDKVLEIHPGQDMEIRGRVHSNDTVRLFPGNAAVRFHDWMTSAKVIEGARAGWAAHAWVGFPLLDPPGPDALFDISSRGFRPLHEQIPAWEAWSQTHRVAYGSRGGVCGAVEPLALPLKGVERPRDLLEWREGGDDGDMRARKFAWRATLLFKDGWLDRDLQPLILDKPSRLPPGKVVADGERVTFWDGRDTVMVKVIPVDVGRLQQRGDSLVYLHDHFVDPMQRGKDVGGFLLYNARRLDRPLTIASNTRLYGWGDFNADSAYVDSEGRRGAFPAALVSDAYTQLSNEWDGTEYPKHTRYVSVKGKNPRARAVLNACLMTGLPERNGSWSGQGGYHNLVHFMEDWTGIVFEFSGSAVALWSSRVSTGLISIEHYMPPVRKWSFDPLYGRIENMPPATPRLAGPRLAAWENVRL